MSDSARLSRCPGCLSNNISFIIQTEVNPFTNEIKKLTIAYKCNDCKLNVPIEGVPIKSLTTEQNIQLLRDQILITWNTPKIIQKITQEFVRVPLNENK